MTKLDDLQNGVRGGNWNMARKSHGRDIYRKEEELGKQGPGVAYANQYNSFTMNPKHQ